MNTWEDDFSVGDPTLDSQHRQLILLATRTCLKIDSNTALSNADIKHLLLDFAALTTHHFSREECFLAELGYPKLKSHASKHASFTSTLLACIARIDTQSITRSDLCVLLEDRLIHHILVEDAALRPFLTAIPAQTKTDRSSLTKAPRQTTITTPEPT